MKSLFGLAMLAGFAGTGMAQSMYITAAGLPGEDGVVTLDVVLDATNYTGAFFAWHQYNFNIAMEASGPNTALAGAVGGALAEDQFLETADTTDSNAFGNPWTGGRRPGAFPGSAFNNGGSRFGPGLADLVTDTGISSSEGSIGGRQAAGGAPENNALINQRRVYEIFRFQFTYSADMGIVTFDLTDVVANLYNVAFGTDNVFVQDQMTISGLTIFPAPGVLPVLAAGGMFAARRRR